MKITFLLVNSLLTLIVAKGQSPCPPSSYQELINTAQKVKAQVFDDYWDSWGETPYTVLLVTDDYEYLLNATTKDSSFSIGCQDIPFRPTTFNKSFLATFPAVNWQPTIVIGTPENTGLSAIDWVVTVVHEHFHQLQFGHPEYYSAQESLTLAKGDETGMWMLNHPFPYADTNVGQLIQAMNSNLSLVIKSEADIKSILEEHIRHKVKLKNMIGQEHYSYFNLQLWQEGFARFIETELVTNWINEYDQVNQELFTKKELLDYQDSQFKGIFDDLQNAAISYKKRELFYAMGAAEALLIKRVNKQWSNEYFDKLFDTDKMLKKSVKLMEE